MKDVPQLKYIREHQALSQRALAAMSGVAQNTISQLERGERKATPSTIRKLAEALGVDPSELLAESLVDRFIATGEQARLRLPPEGRAYIEQVVKELEIEHERTAREKAAREKAERAAASRQREALRHSQEAFLQGDIQQAYEQTMEVLSAIDEYDADIAIARSKMGSGDPQDVLEVAQLAYRKVHELWTYLNEIRQYSFHGDLADSYHIGSQDPAGSNTAMDKLLMKAAEAAREWLDFYNQCLDGLDDEIAMRREEVTALEAFVRRLHPRRAPDSGERAPGQEMPPFHRPN
jgi:transcriptional regulator with XRE-family HTH domain